MERTPRDKNAYVLLQK